MEEDFARLLRSMTDGYSNGVSSPDDAWNADSQSDSDELNALLHERAQTHLTAITAALRRLDSGTYGVCVRCKSRISFARLTVMPEATLCVACGGT